jgi:hypothetical protein
MTPPAEPEEISRKLSVSRPGFAAATGMITGFEIAPS